MEVRCPHCRAPVEFRPETRLSAIICPSCGSSLSLLGTAETTPCETGEAKTIGFTYRVCAGLRITSVELLPLAPSLAARQPATEPPQAPIMHIRTAGAQGNLEAIKRRLAAGARIDGTFIAPAIPASGA